MKCPGCANTLSAVSVENLTVDMCKSNGCGGIWFDQFELERTDDADRIGEELVAMQDSEAKHCSTVDQKRDCPKCAGVKLLRHYFSVKQEVLVDECPSCGGIWLDAGELKKIRSEFNTPEEKEAATKKYLASMFAPDPGNEPAQRGPQSLRPFARIVQFFSRSKA